jgi:uncharacterized pyridoxamine 5'-phosphate oxidase family protein
MLDFISILQENPTGVLATCDGDQVKTRVFLFLFAEEKRMYFCTSSQKPVYKQLQANPNVSFCTWAKDYAPVLSINGKAVFVEDQAIKERVLRETPMLREAYKNAGNPVFKVFYINTETVETFISSEGLKTYTLQQ